MYSQNCCCWLFPPRLPHVRAKVECIVDAIQVLAGTVLVTAHLPRTKDRMGLELNQLIGIH